MNTRRLLCSIAISVLSAAAQSSHPVVLRAARVLDVEAGRMLTPGDVLVEGERIAGVARDGQRLARGAARVIAGGGATLMPGLIESHAHLGFASCIDRPPGFGPMLEPDVRAEATTHAGAVLLDYGFTSAYSAGAIDAALEVSLREKFASGDLPGPRLRACSFERDGAAAAHGGQRGCRQSHQTRYDR